MAKYFYGALLQDLRKQVNIVDEGGTYLNCSNHAIIIYNISSALFL